MYIMVLGILSVSILSSSSVQSVHARRGASGQVKLGT